MWGAWIGERCVELWTRGRPGRGARGAMCVGATGIRVGGGGWRVAPAGPWPVRGAAGGAGAGRRV